MKYFTTPTLKETRVILMKTYPKSDRYKGRAALESIKAKLEDSKKHV